MISVCREIGDRSVGWVGRRNNIEMKIDKKGDR
jgi:hypothetical protein